GPGDGGALEGRAHPATGRRPLDPDLCRPRGPRRRPARAVRRRAGRRHSAVPGRGGGLRGLRLGRPARARATDALRRPRDPGRDAGPVRLGHRLGPPDGAGGGYFDGDPRAGAGAGGEGGRPRGVGYAWGAQLDRVPRTRYDDLAIPDAMLGLYDWVIAWDHQTEQAWVISTGIPEQGPARRERAARRLAFVKERLADRRIGGSAGSEGTTSVPSVYPPTRLSAPSYPVPDVPGVR